MTHTHSNTSSPIKNGFASILVSLANGISWTIVLSGVLAVLFALAAEFVS